MLNENTFDYNEFVIEFMLNKNTFDGAFLHIIKNEIL